MFKLKFQRKSTSLILVIILILVLSYYLGLSRFSNKYITLTTNPIIRVANYISSSLADFISLYLNRADLQQKNNELRTQLINLAQHNIQLELLKQENDYLKKELEFLDDYQYEYVVARVLGQSLNYNTNHILIDKGSTDGLKPGLAVTTNQGVIIGKITKTEDNLAYIQFLIDNRCPRI
jgi:rod shape-determining protein MreC